LYNIRLFNADKDLQMLQAWNAAYNEVAPVQETIPADSSYVLEIDSTPALFLSLIKTNASYCYFENYCGNPEFKGKRLDATEHLIQYVSNEAKKAGHSLILTFAYKPKLVEQFQRNGFTKALDGLTAFYRRIP
jgi:hypothetical protein